MPRTPSPDSLPNGPSSATLESSSTTSTSTSESGPLPSSPTWSTAATVGASSPPSPPRLRRRSRCMSLFSLGQALAPAAAAVAAASAASLYPEPTPAPPPTLAPPPTPKEAEMETTPQTSTHHRKSYTWHDVWALGEDSTPLSDWDLQMLEQWDVHHRAARKKVASSNEEEEALRSILGEDEGQEGQGRRGNEEPAKDVVEGFQSSTTTLSMWDCTVWPPRTDREGTEEESGSGSGYWGAILKRGIGRVFQAVKEVVRVCKRRLMGPREEKEKEKKNENENENGTHEWRLALSPCTPETLEPEDSAPVDDSLPDGKEDVASSQPVVVPLWEDMPVVRRRYRIDARKANQMCRHNYISRGCQR